jgi:release factor glutamine methyltransferase
VSAALERLALHVPDGVYAPRSDTALLAGILADWPLQGLRVLDLCTGSGALALVAAQAGARVTAVDRSPDAVAAARANAERAGLEVEVLHGHLFEPVTGRRFDLVTANPPYLPAERDECHRWDAGSDGRTVLDEICARASNYLDSGGSLVLVHSSLNDEAVTLAAMERHGLEPRVLARQPGPPGPLVRARLPFLQERGLWPPDGIEHLVALAGAK